VVTALTCSLVGQTHAVRLEPGSLAARLYGRADAVEDYYCNYGLNPAYRARLEQAGLRTSGVGDEGEVRLVELPGHPFFVATLFLPQSRSAAGTPHPLLAGWAAAARDAARARTGAR
jgi:CTP synthase (UTP-ammonia lyase)